MRNTKQIDQPSSRQEQIIHKSIKTQKWLDIKHVIKSRVLTHTV